MPNWVYNTLTIEGNPDMVIKLKNQMNEPFKVNHDSWNTDTMEMEIKEVSYSNPVFAFWNIIAPTDLEAYIKQPEQSKIKSGDVGWWEDTMAIAKVDNSWYSWNNRNWGVKWDVAVADGNEYPDTELYTDEANGENHVLVYGFQTAWGIPLSALEKLSAQYPTLLFTLSYEEETGWGGEYEFLKGEVTAESNYESKCRDCDAEDTIEYCDTCAIDVCSECKDFNEANPNDVAECEEHREFANAN